MWRSGSVLVLFLALLHCWSVRFQLNPDGVSYVDMARSIAAGDWTTARNSTWSPLFPALTAVFLKTGIFPHTLGREWVAAHIATFLLFLAALFAFAQFWKTVGDGDDGPARRFPALWPTLGLLLFATNFIPLLEVLTPDIGVAAVFFAVATLLIRAQSRSTSIPFALAFGALLGLGYLVKTVLFPIGLVALFAFAAVLYLRKQRLLPVAAAVASFLIVSGPWVWLTSHAEHRLTFGEAGRLAYAFNVGGYRFDENTKIPIGQKLAEHPAIYQVPVRPGITFSPLYDPALLGKSIRARLQLSKQLPVLYGNYKILRDLFLVSYGALVLGWLVLFLANPCWRALRHWAPLLVALAGLGLYCAVLIEARYISAFVLVVFGSLLGGVALPRDAAQFRITRIALLAATCMLGFLALPSVASYSNFRTRPNPQLEIARHLQSLRLPANAEIAVVGDPQWQFWAQASHLRISAVIPPRQMPDFLALQPAVREGVLATLASTGAQVVVLDLKGSPAPGGCTPLTGTEFCVLTLPRPPSQAQ